MTTHLDANRSLSPRKPPKTAYIRQVGPCPHCITCTHTRDSAAGGLLPEPFRLQLLGDLLVSMIAMVYWARLL